MLRWLSAGILVLALLLLAVASVSADTGTYKINNYIVTLEPQNDGRVLITVEQQWEVLSGSIPWVTVGLPNNKFEIRDFSGDVSRVSNGSSGGFYGVRVDLDEDYQPGQTFNLKFTVLQGNLLERLTDENKWRINYTPGWYDRAAIGHLQVNLISPVSYQTYITSNPMPAVNGNVVTWERTNVNPGGRLDIKVESADGSFLTAEEPKTSSGKGLGTGFYVVIGIIVVIGLLIVSKIRQTRKQRDEDIRRRATAIEQEMSKDPLKKQAVEEDFKEYVEKKKLQPDAQGRYYDSGYGGYMTPWIWAAVISSQHRPASPSPSSHTHTRPSCVACACVSCACACACACAGGGAAGCSRKTLHECRDCTIKKQEKTGTENAV
jgi:hypothetical protein